MLLYLLYLLATEQSSSLEVRVINGPGCSDQPHWTSWFIPKIYTNDPGQASDFVFSLLFLTKYIFMCVCCEIQYTELALTFHN